MFSKLVGATLLISSVFGGHIGARPHPPHFEEHHCWRSEITLKDLNRVATFKSFQEYVMEYKKLYTSIEEESKRYMIWLDNMHTIASENSKGKTYTLRANQFTDLTPEEFRMYVHGKDGACFKPDEKLTTIKEAEPVKVEGLKANPASVDWRSKGVVTPVKNQGQCGSCWAFSATGAMECDYAIKSGKLNSLSEQELVDCCHIAGSAGCNGGQMYAGMEYAAQNGGLCSESEYRYTARDGTCKASSCGTKYDKPTGNGYKGVTRDSATAMENAVVQGCVSIGIEADQTAFQSYSGGVLTGNCGTRIDHGVLIVGYGTEGSQKYWLVKNSWGTSWGEQGYVKICKECNKNGNQGECGILKEGNVPTY